MRRLVVGDLYITTPPPQLEEGAWAGWTFQGQVRQRERSPTPERLALFNASLPVLAKRVRLSHASLRPAWFRGRREGVTLRWAEASGVVWRTPRDQGRTAFGPPHCDSCGASFHTLNQPSNWYHQGDFVVLDDCQFGKQSADCSCDLCFYQRGTGQRHAACLCAVCLAHLRSGFTLALEALEGIASAGSQNHPSVREILAACGQPYTPKR